VKWVTETARLARQLGTDGFISIGGGSASDSAKAVALLLAEGGELAQHAIRFTPPDQLMAPVLKQPKLPIIAVVCTASGSEVTPSLGVSDDHGKKLLFQDLQLTPRVVIIDPVANLEVPIALMLSTGMNALAHALEGLYSKQRSPISEALAIETIHKLPAALMAAHAQPDELAARSALLEAAHLGGLVIANARTCLHHAVCHAIGAYCSVPHGEANAVMLPHALRFNAAHTHEALSRAARAWGCGETPEALIAAVVQLQKNLQVPYRLRDIGVPQAALKPIALKTMGERGLYFNPRVVTKVEEMEELLAHAY
jgi:alcohol dehydrogenase